MVAILEGCGGICKGLLSLMKVKIGDFVEICVVRWMIL